MDVIDALPAELILRILSFLPLQALRNVRLISRRWNHFIVTNQSTIYHHAALLHKFIDSLDTLLPEAREARPLKFLKDVPDWYQYCKKYFLLQKNWTGGGSGTLKCYGGHPYDIHRIKVDEKHGLVITTHEFGGLTVFDMETTEVLWRLNTGYVRRYAHCEYENGFLIFDRIGVSKEVWRLETLYDSAEEPAVCRPDAAQMQAWRDASQQWATTAPRGHFRPWALINNPEFGRAYRFVYPDLLVSGLRKAYVWDVRTAALVLELENVQGEGPGTDGVGDINYVELSATHVFVCSSSALRVFSRESKAMVLMIPSYQLVYSDVRLAVRLDPAVARHGHASPDEVVDLPCEPTHTTSLYNASYAEFSAVHVSRDGADLVAQLSDSRVVMIRDFMRIARGEVALRAATLELGKVLPRMQGTEEHFSIYLAFEHGRAGVITTSGVYVLSLDPTEHGLLDADAAARAPNAHRIPRAAVEAGLSFPHLRIAALPYYADRRTLTKVTCVQMTESRLFFVWDAMYRPENVEFFRRLGMIGGRARGGGAGGPPGAGAAAGVAAAEEGAGDVQEAAPAEGDPEPGWDPTDIEDADAALGEQHPEAGPATDAAAGALVDFVPIGDDDEEEWEDEDEEDDADGIDDQDILNQALGADVGGLLPVPGLHPDLNFVSTGPIVFCIDFSPV